MSVPETPPSNDTSRNTSQNQGLIASASKSSKRGTIIKETSSVQVPPGKIESRAIKKSGAHDEPQTGFPRRNVSFSMLDEIDSDDSDGLPSTKNLIRMLQSKEKVVTTVKPSLLRRPEEERFQILEDITERSKNEMQEDKFSGGECNEDFVNGGGFTIEDILGCVDIV